MGAGGVDAEAAEGELAAADVVVLADGDRAGLSALALHGDQAAFEAAQLEMDEEDQRAASARLAELEVSDEEYFAPSTRLEAIDIVVDTIRSRRMAEGDPIEMALTPEDYES